MKYILRKSAFILFLPGMLFACNSPEKLTFDDEILASMGSKYKTEYLQTADEFKAQIADDSTNVNSLLGLAETNVILYIFGYSSREETIPEAQIAVQKARSLDSLNAEVLRLTGIMSFLDWDWQNAKTALRKAIHKDPENLSARHWYSLYLAAMGQFTESMAQSDTIMTLDPDENYLIGRGSLLYFQHQFSEVKQLMQKTIAMDTTVPWGYDWLGMAYNGLEEHGDAIKTYFKAFALSDGTVEVGAGLGHALGLAGEVELAKQMADYYQLRAQNNYLPPVQRSFIHIGIGEYDKAIELLEQAYKEHSWFLIFIQIEPWYDPIRDNQRFQDIILKMQFPE